MNEFVLRKTREAILAEPKHFAMDVWDCGTEACIAGWIFRVAGEPMPKTDDNTPDGWLVTSSEVLTKVCRILKISPEGARRLCYDDCWPPHLEAAYWENSWDNVARAQVAAERVELFIQTEGRE